MQANIAAQCALALVTSEEQHDGLAASRAYLGPDRITAATAALRSVGCDRAAFVYDGLRVRATAGLNEILENEKLTEQETGRMLTNLARKHGICYSKETSQRSAHGFSGTDNEQHDGPAAKRACLGPDGKTAAMAALRSVGCDRPAFVFDGLRVRATASLNEILEDKKLTEQETGRRLTNLARKHGICYTKELRQEVRAEQGTHSVEQGGQPTGVWMMLLLMLQVQGTATPGRQVSGGRPHSDQPGTPAGGNGSRSRSRELGDDQERGEAGRPEGAVPPR